MLSKPTSGGWLYDTGLPRASGRPCSSPAAPRPAAQADHRTGVLPRSHFESLGESRPVVVMPTGCCSPRCSCSPTRGCGARLPPLAGGLGGARRRPGSRRPRLLSEADPWWVCARPDPPRVRAAPRTQLCLAAAAAVPQLASWFLLGGLVVWVTLAGVTLVNGVTGLGRAVQVTFSWRLLRVEGRG